MSLLTRPVKALASAYYNARGKSLKMQDGQYTTRYNVSHESERCGWERFGAKNETEYERWWQEACGIVSLRIIMDALQPSDATNRTVFFEIKDAIKSGAYLEKNVDGKMVRVGWIHHKLVALANGHGLKGRSVRLTTAGICRAILSDKLVMASIYRPFSRFIDENAPRKKAGGHLVVVSGFIWKNGRCDGFFVADPYDTEAREQPIAVNLFEDIYSGSAILFYE